MRRTEAVTVQDSRPYAAGLAIEPGGPAAVPAAPEQVLAALDPEQRAVALAVRGPVCVLAGAGTGKTRAITHRIAYAVHTGAVDPSRVLAVTFTTRAAAELRARLRRLGTPGLGLDQVRARTFHSAALRQLGHFWPAVVGGPPPRVLGSKASLVAEAARALRIQAGRAELTDIAAEIEWAKVTQARPDDYADAAAQAGRRPPLPADQIAQVFAGYEKLRRERHLIDFESVLELTAAILAENRRIAAEVRDRYRHLVVDEYQDVNPLQKLLLDAWLGERDDLCVVGDPEQAIYSFAGASPGYLTGFAAEFPGATMIRLIRDYRSSPQVVALANRLTVAAGHAAGDAVARWASGLVAQQPPGPDPSFTEYPDEEAEAEAVAARAGSLIGDGVPPGQIAVLVRANAQTQRFERAMTDAGVPYQVRGAERFFERPEVRQAMGLLRAAAKFGPGAGAPVQAADPADRGGADTAEGPAGRGSGARGADDPAEHGGSAHGGAAGTESGRDTAGVLTAEVKHVLSGLGLTEAVPQGGAARERWESLAAIIGLAGELSATEPGATLARFAAELTARAAAENPPVTPGVTLSSLHAAKGLEWDVVFLPSLVEGVLPIVHAQTPDALAEERRLLYVGITRARRRVELSWPAARLPGGRPGRKPSRFLAEIRPRSAAARPGGADVSLA